MVQGSLPGSTVDDFSEVLGSWILLCFYFSSKIISVLNFLNSASLSPNSYFFVPYKFYLSSYGCDCEEESMQLICTER